MGIDAKHAYRFGFLKSQEWRDIRLEIMARAKAKCKMCWTVDWSNDVHHIKYNKQWGKTMPGDTIVLCRKCHEKAHEIFEHKMPTKNKGILQVSLRKCFVENGYNFIASDVMGEVALMYDQSLTELERFKSVSSTVRHKIRKYLTEQKNKDIALKAVDEILHEIYG